MKAQYINIEFFKEYAGIDLRSKLQEDANESNKSESFLWRVEERMLSFMEANFHKNINRLWSSMSDYQKTHYKYALCEQALYVLENGDLSVDSGYDIEKGEIIDSHKKKNIIIGENARNELILCGLWNRNVEFYSFSPVGDY